MFATNKSAVLLTDEQSVYSALLCYLNPNVKVHTVALSMRGAKQQ